MKSFLVDQDGYYGEFGGAYVPEILHKCVEELKNKYLEVLESEEFKKEFEQLLRDYVGRPSPLYPARCLSKKYECHVPGGDRDYGSSQHFHFLNVDVLAFHIRFSHVYDTFHIH